MYAAGAHAGSTSLPASGTPPLLELDVALEPEPEPEPEPDIALEWAPEPELEPVVAVPPAPLVSEFPLPQAIGIATGTAAATIHSARPKTLRSCRSSWRTEAVIFFPGNAANAIKCSLLEREDDCADPGSNFAQPRAPLSRV